MDWSQSKSVAVLKDGDTLVAKVYLGPDGKTLRIVLPKLSAFTVDLANRLVDFKL